MSFEALGGEWAPGRLRGFAHRVGIPSKLQRAGRKPDFDAQARVEGTRSPECMRNAIEELGLSFVKLGRVLAGQADRFEIEWREELASLRAHAS